MSNLLMNLVWKVRLPPFEKIVLARCADRANDAGHNIFLSVPTISVETGLSRSSVFRALSKLEKAGLLLEDPDAPPRRSTSRMIAVEALIAHASQSEKSRHAKSRKVNRPSQDTKREAASPNVPIERSDAQHRSEKADDLGAVPWHSDAELEDRSKIEGCQAETNDVQDETQECQTETDDSHSDTLYIPYTSSKHPSIQGTSHSDDLLIVKAFDDACQGVWGHRRLRKARSDLEIAASWRALGATAETVTRMSAEIFNWMLSNDYEAPGSLAAIDSMVRARIERGRAIEQVEEKSHEGQVGAWTIWLKGWGKGGAWHLFMGAEPEAPDWRMSWRVPPELRSVFLEEVEHRKSWLAQRSK